MSLWVLLLAVMNHSGTCQKVGAERILASDLANLLPVFAAVPRDTILGYAPAPGMRRVVDYPELTRFGLPYRISVPEETQVCFERKMQPVDDASIRSAILESLRNPEAQVEILAKSGGFAPEGKFLFPLTGLTVSTTIDPVTPVLWRGHVLYDTGRKYSVWARVRITAKMTRVVALRALPVGEAVHAEQVRLETYDGFPLRNEMARRLDDVVGRATIRIIHEGSPVLRTDLTEPFQVRRGELVTVTVVSGATQIQLEALAEAQGRQGDVISLRNPRSGKMFRARIEGRGRAIVIPGMNALVARVQ